MTKQYKPRLSVCRELTHGNGNAAELLYRVAFWLPKAGTKRDGRKWIANDRSWWMQQTGLSFDQVKRALAHLKKRGLIETKQALYGNLNILHIRLTKQTNSVLQLDQSQHGDCDAASFGESGPPPPEGCEAAPLYKIQGDTPGKVLQKEKHCVLSHEPPGVDEESKTGKSYNKTFTPVPGEEGVDSSKKVAKHPASKVPALEATWRATVAEVHGSYTVPLTDTQRGQLKTFSTGCPEETALAVLEYAVRKWDDFREQAQMDAGAFNMPAKPEIGFLTKYREVVINMWLAAAKKTPGPMAAFSKPAIKTAVPAKKPIPSDHVFMILGLEEPD